jgi:hypothetical protein
MEQEIPKKRHSLGVEMPAKRQPITVVVKGGFYPSDTIDAKVDPRSEPSAKSSTVGIVDGNIVESSKSIEEVAEDCCDGGAKIEDNDADVGEKVKNEENSSQK